MKSSRVIAPVFLAALQVIFAFLFLAWVMFAYGGLATAVAAFWLMGMVVQWGLAYWAYKSGLEDGVRRER